MCTCIQSGIRGVGLKQCGMAFQTLGSAERFCLYYRVQLGTPMWKPLTHYIAEIVDVHAEPKWGNNLCTVKCEKLWQTGIQHAEYVCTQT